MIVLLYVFLLFHSHSMITIIISHIFLNEIICFEVLQKIQTLTTGNDFPQFLPKSIRLNSICSAFFDRMRLKENSEKIKTARPEEKTTENAIYDENITFS